MDKHCDWCGGKHDLKAICAHSPRARGVSRRSFLMLGAMALASHALPMPTVELKSKVFTYDAIADVTREWFVNSAVLRSGDGSASVPFKTVFEAIVSARKGDTIIVAPSIASRALLPIDIHAVTIEPFEKSGIPRLSDAEGYRVLPSGAGKSVGTSP